MISLKTFFKNRAVKFFLIIFGATLLVSNLSVYTLSNNQYEIESKRQLDSFQEMLIHLLTMESEEVAIIYTEHFYHTQGINIAYYDELGNLVYVTDQAPDSEIRINLFDEEENFIGSILYDDQNSHFGNEMTRGLLILNGISLLLFLIFLRVLFWYLNSWYALLEKDLQAVGQRTDNFNFTDLEAVSKRMKTLIDSEKRIREHQKEYVKFLAHDIKTPLTVIKAYLEGISLGKIELDEETIRDLLNETKQIEDMIPKLITQNANYQNPVQNIKPIIENIITRLQEVFQIKKINFSQTLEDVFLEVSEVDITRIIENLLFNAYYYNHESGSISLELTNEPKSIVIKDLGIGMSKDTIEAIRKAPYRSKEAYKHHKQGSGMGLQIVFDIAKRHNYEVIINSEESKGTEVIVKFE